ncbi:hypothetical protein P168DRAFT_289025 [Aspergillus campestris IBT 28561]|uniref:Uncharacterized protein n=1 Tax=Aspergillus campestris (strain IBT 28561) TaxID=1392248 RepID=A0A2I1D6Q7_ASPC2|nr:uncharacterized protein P168DRAFT_289025 [Aspergillus campestris IBT 28561]PKY05566.1 hypothetical protein P168DRAFT_289025 [Aspergillus campestris IBT 28561]
MAPSLCDLIDFLLAEIALCGAQGASPADVLALVDTFYAKAPQQGSSRTQTVDRRFQAKVWTWLIKNPEVSVGQNREWNHLSLDDAERHGCAQSDARDSQETASDIRVFVSEERTWLAITGHEPDETKVLPMEFTLLSIIASRKSQGIVQTELVRLSGQDKRSVPKRTDMLQKKGYIEKRAIQIKSARTSLCTLRKFLVPEHSTTGMTTDSGPDARPDDDQMIDFEKYLDNLFSILREHEIISRHDLKTRLGFADRWRWKILSRSLRKFERIGLLMRVRALSQYTGTGKHFHSCVRLVREPTKRDYELFHEYGQSLITNLEEANAELDEDMEPTQGIGEPSLQTPDGLEMAKQDEDVEVFGRPIPIWTPDRVVHNQVFDVVDATGTAGCTNREALQTCFGQFYRRPLENMLTRLVECWQLSQPLHLRHRAIVRDIALQKTITHYIQYSAGNFRKVVDAGEAAWEAVEYTPKGNKSSSLRPPPANAQPDLDDYGLPRAVPTKDLVKKGRASLFECIATVGPQDYVCSSSDLKAMQLDDGSYAIYPGERKLPAGGSRDPDSTPRRPRGTPIRLKIEDPDTPDGELLDTPNSARIVEPRYSRKLKTREDSERFHGMSELEKLKCLGLDETWTEYSILLMERSSPGVYITPRRPRISRLAAFRSPKLMSLPCEPATPAQQDQRELSTPATASHFTTPSRGVKRSLRQRASLMESSPLRAEIVKHRRLDEPEVDSADVSMAVAYSPTARGHSKRKRTESPTPEQPTSTDRDQNSMTPTRTTKTPLKKARPASSLPDSAMGDPSAGDNMGSVSNQDTTPATPHNSEVPDTSSPRMKMAEKGGSMGYLRRKIVMDIVDKVGGAFPLGADLWYPFATAWRKTKTAFTFSGKDSKGVMPDDPRIKYMQGTILASEARIPLPPSVEVDPELSKNGGRKPVLKDPKTTYPIPVDPGLRERRKGRSIQRRLLQRLNSSRGKQDPANPKVVRLASIQRRSGQDGSVSGLTSIFSPDQVGRSAKRRVNPLLQDGSNMRRLCIPISSIAPYAMLMSPKQTFNASSGTFSTDAGLAALQSPRVGGDLPRSLEDLLNKTRRDTLKRADLRDPRSVGFFRDNDTILRWELENEDFLGVKGDDLMYINQAIYDSFDSAPVDGDIRFDVDEPKPEGLAAIIGRPVTRRQTGGKRRSLRESGSAYLESPMDRLNMLDPETGLYSEAGKAEAAATAQDDVPRIRRNRLARLVSPNLFQRIMTAIVIVRTLAGGYDGRMVDWNLVAKAFPDYDESFIQDRGKAILNKNRLQLAKMQSDFQERFIEAYAQDQVPPINYDDLDGYDWVGLANWANTQVDVPRSETHPDLPATREQFDSVFEIREEPLTSLEEVYQANNSVTVNRRRALLAGVPYAAPLADKPKQAGPRKKELAQMEAAKSWVRANVITFEEKYKPAEARVTLSHLGEDLINNALQSLMTDRVISSSNRGRISPGRNYTITDLFLQTLGRKRAIECTELRRAARFKTTILDPALQAKGSFDVNYHAEDGDILAAINLAAEGRLLLKPRDPPLEKFGLTDGGYLTRLIDKDKLHFSVELHPTDRQHHAPMPPLLTISPDISVPEKIPMWFDIHGGFVKVLWDLALAAVVGCIATRPGVSAGSVTNMVKPTMGAWEVELLLGWMEEVGVVVRQGCNERGETGWVVREWWWMVLAAA